MCESQDYYHTIPHEVSQEYGVPNIHALKKYIFQKSAIRDESANDRERKHSILYGGATMTRSNVDCPLEGQASSR